MRALTAAALLALLAGCGGQERPTASAAPETKSKPKLHVRLTAQSHHPRVGERWHYEVRVTDAAGRPVAADIHLQFLYGAIPVGQVGRHHVANGVWSETFGTTGNPPFPARARGQPLVLQAIAKARGHTTSATWSVRVR